MRYTLCLIILITGFTACTELDSGGVYDTATLDRRAALVEELRIDGVANDLVPFDGQSSGAVAVALDGAIAINQPQDHMVRFFGPGGEPQGSFGGEGSGPGEFQRAVQLGWLADSLWIYDAALHRVTVLMPQRELARTVSLAAGAHPPADQADEIPSAEFSFIVGVRPLGEFISRVLPYWDRSPKAYQQHSFFAALTREGTITRVVARIPAGETTTMADGGSASIPFANRTMAAVSRDASVAAFARATVQPDAPSVRLHAFGPTGDTLFIRDYPIDLVPLPRSVRDTVLAHFRSRLSFSTALADAVEEAVWKIESYPPLKDLIVGRDGTFWISLADRDGQRRYLAVAPDGEPLGRVHLGEHSRIAEAERERIWVIEKDEMDVESLVRYRVAW